MLESRTTDNMLTHHRSPTMARCSESLRVKDPNTNFMSAGENNESFYGTSQPQIDSASG